MSETQRDCREPAGAQTTEHAATTGRWLTECPVSDAPLPPDVANVTSQFYGTESVETLDGFVTATPSGMVVSFGIATNAPERGDDALTVEVVYEAICPSVKGFPSQERYERWAVSVDAATVGLPLAAGTPIAAVLTGAVRSTKRRSRIGLGRGENQV